MIEYNKPKEVIDLTLRDEYRSKLCFPWFNSGKNTYRIQRDPYPEVPRDVSRLSKPNNGIWLTTSEHGTYIATTDSNSRMKLS